MDTMQILCTLRDVNSFLDVFPFDLQPLSGARFLTLIVHADTHTKEVSHLRLTTCSSSSYYIHSYGMLQLVPYIEVFIRHNCTT
jgi:hypothetical protein